MPNSETETVLELLAAVREGDPESLDRLFQLVYDELRRLAEAVRRGRAGETLNATSLVHEAYMKLAASPGLEVHDRAHFFRIAARAMRQVLSDAAARRSAAKRGHGQPLVTLETTTITADRGLTGDELLDLDRALTALGERNPRQLAIVECHLLVGLTLEETAAAVSTSVATVGRDLRFARAWLSKRLRDGTDGADA